MRTTSSPLMACILASALAPIAMSQNEPVPTLPVGPFNNTYQIDVTLNDRTMVLDGVATVTFRNLFDAPVEVVPFHLYPNAWANTASNWIRDSRRESLILDRGEEGCGYMLIRSVRDGAGGDLSAATELDETLMRVRLPAPLAKDQEVTFVVAFRTKLPEIFARMGKFGDHVNAMQWFPKLCAHIDGEFVDPHFRHPSEFFADFGRYEVSITVPEDYLVEATGKRLGEPIVTASSEDPDVNVKQVRFEATAVHDFAWCASPSFVRFDTTTDSGVEIVLLSQPFMEPKNQLVLDAMRFMVEKYGEWFFPYPYPRVVINTVPHGRGGGMEYPMLFTIGSRAPEYLRWIRERSEDPAGVTVHEFGHQYWHGMVATNEFEEAWLDEGVTTYVSYKMMQELFHDPGEGPGLALLQATRVYQPVLDAAPLLTRVVGYRESPFLNPDGRNGAKLFGFALPSLRYEGSFPNRFHVNKETYVPFALNSPLKTRSWEIYRQRGESSYRSMAYSKPALMLRTLEGKIGWDRMKELLRSWSRRYAFRHPTSEDFIALVDEATSGEFHAFLEECVYGSETIDFAVEEVRAYEVTGPKGFLLPVKPGEDVTVDFEMPDRESGVLDGLTRFFSGSEPVSAVPEPGEEILHASEVVVRNRGRLWLPTEVELRFSDGSLERIALDERRPWYVIQPEPRAARLVAAVVDPDRIIALDLDVTNNGRLARRDDTASRSFALFYQFWIQSWLSGVAWFS